MTEPARQSSLTCLAPRLAVDIKLMLQEANRQLLELNRDGLRVGVFETLRTAERQSWLYAQGRTRKGTIITNAPTVRTSWHGYGLAADFAFVTREGNWTWAVSDDRWLWLAKIGQAFGLRSGYFWKSKDSPHFQPESLRNTPSSIGQNLHKADRYRDVWRIIDYDRLTDLQLAMVRTAA